MGSLPASATGVSRRLAGPTSSAVVRVGLGREVGAGHAVGMVGGPLERSHNRSATPASGS